MKSASLKWLVCPVPGCAGPLSPSDSFEPLLSGADGLEIVEAILECATCAAEYPVVLGAALLVPNLPQYLIAFSQEIQRCGRQLPDSGISTSMRRHLGFAGAFMGQAEPESWDENLDWTTSPYIQAHFDRNSLAEDLPEGWWRTALTQFQDTIDPYKFLAASARARSAPGARSGLLVEVGASVGRMSADLAPNFAYCLGMDFSFTAVLAARRLLLCAPKPMDTYALETEKGQVEMRPLTSAPAPQNLDFVVADGGFLPFAGGSAACVIALNLLCAVPDPARVMSEFSRVIAGSGLLLLSTPYWFDDGPSPFATGGPEWMKQALAGDFVVLEEQDMVPWLLKLAKRRWNLYLCQCVVAARVGSS